MGAAVTAPEPARPQPGPQRTFLACKSDIGIYGGGVYGGKTWALTAGPLNHKDVPGFSAVTFRRTRPDIRNPGSLWDESMKWYPNSGGTPREAALEWDWPSGALVKMDGLQHDTDALSWKSAQITLLQFDQLEEFTEFQFWYMHTRNRSQCGVRPYCRAGCNPMADTWLAAFLQWWWHPETGYAIPERSGLARFFVRINDEVQWAAITCPCDAEWETWLLCEAAARAEIEARYPNFGQFVLSVAFIRAKLSDNRIGVIADPDYEGRVRAGSVVEQERLLWGNWKIRAAAGLVFDRGWFEIVDAMPLLVRSRVRYWDKAGTSGGGDWTVGTRESLDLNGITYIEDVVRGQWGAGQRENVIDQTAKNDPEGTRVGVEQEPGSGGKDSAIYTITNLGGFDVRRDLPSGQLVERAQPLAAQAQVGNVKLVRGAWNEQWLREHHAFPTPGVADDTVSSSSGAFKLLHRLPPLRPRRGGSRSFVSG